MIFIFVNLTTYVELILINLDIFQVSLGIISDKRE